MHRLASSILVIALLVTGAVGCSNERPTPNPASEMASDASEPAQEQQWVTLIDKPGHYVKVRYPVQRIVSLNQGMSQLICALDEADRLVGRSVYCTFPSYLKEVTAVGKSSQPNFELIVEGRPDVVVADPMLYDTTRAKIESLGIPVYVDSTSDPDRLMALVRNFGLMLGKEETAEAIAAHIGGYTDLVEQRISNLELEEGTKPTVFFEFKSAYKSASAESTFHKPIVAAGGINIAAGQPISSPVVSSEWVFESNPSIIVHRVSGDEKIDEMAALRTEIMSRAGLKDLEAVREGRVCVIKADAFLTVRYPVGLLYYAKWFHPDIFADTDPAAVHREIVERYFGAEEWERLIASEAFAYPE